MYQSKSAAAGLGDDDEQISAGRAPKQARGGEFGQCEVFRRAKPQPESSPVDFSDEAGIPCRALTAI